MATLEERLKDPDYNRWVRAGVCLGLVKSGLEVFADQTSGHFHQAVLNQLRQNGNPSINGICLQATVWKGKVSCCNNCQGFVDEIDRQNMKKFKFKQGNWDNANIQVWHKEPWEMAKVFMNPGQKGSQKTPSDTDLSGILNFIDHCVIAKKDIVNTKNLSKVRDCRNIVMHSASMTMPQQDFDNCIDAMIDLLEDPGQLGTMTLSMETVKSILEVKKADFSINKDRESEVLTEMTKAIKLKLDSLQLEVSTLCSESAGILEETKKSGVSLKELESNLGKNMSSLTERLDAIEMGEFTIKNTLHALTERLKEDEDLKLKLWTKLEKFDTSLEDVRSLHKVLSREMSQVHHRLETFEDGLAIQKQHGNILVSRQNTLEQRANSLEEQVKAIQTAADTASRAVDDDCKVLKRCLLEEYKRAGFEISISPIYEDSNEDIFSVSLDEVYTDLKIVKPQKGEEYPLSSYKEIFNTESKQNRTIIVKGEAGVGKSTWCMKLVQVWTRVHERLHEGATNPLNTPSPIITDHESKDLEEAMSSFDYLFFIPLRYVDGKQSVKDILLSSTLQRLSNYLETVHHIIDRYSEKVLIILDGLDEYPLDLSYDGLNKCTVISTTRPWKYDLVCKRKPKIDNVLKIEGLDENGVMLLAEKFFRAFSSQSSVAYNEQSIWNFMETIRTIGMSDSLKTPLILLIMLESYLEKGCLSPSRTRNMFCLVETLIVRGEQKLSDTELTKLQQLKELWSAEDNSDFHIIFGNNEILTEYTGLLQKLSKLAYERLNRPEKEYNLIFNEKELKEYLSPDELQICLRYGLLSKSKQFTSFLTRMKVSVTFYHKLFQEFFAAVWIINSDVCFTRLILSLTYIRDVLEIESVIYFIYSMDPHLGSKLSKRLADICNRDPIILDQRNDFSSAVVLPTELYHLTNILLQCQTEVTTSDQSFEPVYATDISIFSDMPKCSFSMDTVLALMEGSKHSLKSFFAQCVAFELVKCRRLFELINGSVAIETLVIVMPSFISETNSREKLSDFNLDFSRHFAFKNCYLVGRGQSMSSGLLPLVRNLGSAKSISRLRLRNIGSECCNALSGVILELQNLDLLYMDNMEFTEGDLILKNPKLQILHTRNLTLKTSSLVLTNVHGLVDVSIKLTDMSRLGWEELLNQLSYQSNLESLIMQNINCFDGKLDLENCTRLEVLRLHNFSVSDIRISTCTQLQVLDIRKMYLPSSPVHKELDTRELQRQHSNIDVVADDINKGLGLSLEIDGKHYGVTTDCDVAGLQELSFSYSSWERILGTLPVVSIHELVFHNLHIGNARIALENCRHLKTISLCQLTVSEECYSKLFRSLAGLELLTDVDIKDLCVSGVLKQITLEDIKAP